MDLVPEEAIAAGREAFVRCPKGTSSTRAAIEAAAPLILAAELRRLADEIGAAATLAHESAGEGDDRAGLVAAATLSTAAKLRSRASVLRGEGDPK